MLPIDHTIVLTVLTQSLDTVYILSRIALSSYLLIFTLQFLCSRLTTVYAEQLPHNTLIGGVREYLTTSS